MFFQSRQLLSALSSNGLPDSPRVFIAPLPNLMACPTGLAHGWLKISLVRSCCAQNVNVSSDFQGRFLAIAIEQTDRQGLET